MKDYEVYIFVGGDRLANLVAFIKRIRFRTGLLSKLSTFFFLNKGIRQSRSQVEMHEAEYNLNLLEKLSIFYKSDKKNEYNPELILSEEEKLTAKK